MPWRADLASKPVEYWAVIMGMAIYVTMRDEALPLTKRTLKTLASALLSFALSEAIAPWVRGSEILAAIIIMAVGLIVLDVLVALFQDRDFVKDILKQRLGLAKPDEGDKP